MKKLLYLFLFLLLLGVGGFIGLQFLLSPEFVTSQMQQAVKSSTGRDLEMNSAPKLSYWPKLSVELEQARLSNPPGMKDGSLAKMQNLKISIDVPALFSRRLQIEEISLVEPVIDLVVNANGQASWSFDEVQPSSAEADAPASEGTDEPGFSNPLEDISLAPVIITNGTLNYRDERTGTGFSANDVNMEIIMPDLQGALKIQGSMNWNDKPLDLTVFVDSPQDLTDKSSTAVLGIKSELLDVSFSGDLSFQHGFGLAGTIDSKTPSIRSLAAWAGSPMPSGKGLGPFYAKSKITIRDDVIALDGGQFGLDTMNAKGNLNIDIAGAVPSVSGNLGVDKIDVNAYLETDKGGADNGTSGENTASASSGWSDEKIDFSALKAVNANLSLVASNIFYQDVRIGRTQVNASLQSGKLDANLTEMAFYDGVAKGRIRLSGASSLPSLKGNLTASGLNGAELLKDFADFDRISGNTGINVDITTAGVSQRQFVSTLNGIVGFKFENGAIKGINIPRMVRSVQSNILGGWESSPEEKTDFSVLEANFDINNGIAKNDDLNLTSPLMRVTGAGDVNIIEQQINYRIEPKVVGSLIGQGGDDELSGLKVPVIIEGPWSGPKIYPDIKGILEDPQSAFDALSKLTGGDSGLDLKAEGQKLEDKAVEEVQNVLDNALPEGTKELLGDDANSLIKDQGGSLLNSILGGD